MAVIASQLAAVTRAFQEHSATTGAQLAALAQQVAALSAVNGGSVPPNRPPSPMNKVGQSSVRADGAEDMSA